MESIFRVCHNFEKLKKRFENTVNFLVVTRAKFEINNGNQIWHEK